MENRHLIRDLFILICLVLCSGSVLGQDVILLRDGNEIKAKVIEVDLAEIKYLKHENPDGPTYHLGKQDVFMIRYENGRKDVFDSSSAPARRDPEAFGWIPSNPAASEPKKPGLAFLYSFLYPGAGQFYAKKPAKAWIMAGAFTGAAIVFFAGGTYYETYLISHWNGDYYESSYTYVGPYWTGTRWVGFGSMIAIKIWSMVDAPISANHTNRRSGLSKIRISPDSYLVNTLIGPPQPYIGASMKVKL